MKKSIFKLILCYFVLNSFNTIAQSNLTFNLKFVGLNGFSRFSDNQYVSKALTLKTARSFGKGFTVKSDLSKNISIEIGYVISRLSYKLIVTSNYIGNKKWSNQLISITTNIHQQYPFNIYYYFNQSKKNQRKYIKIGTSLFVNNYDYMNIISTQYVNPDANPNLQDTLNVVEYQQVKKHKKLLLMLGFGFEKYIFKDRISLGVSLVYNQGFSTLVISDVEYDIDNHTFNNRILNKGTYLGLELNIGFNFFRKQL